MSLYKEPLVSPLQPCAICKANRYLLRDGAEIVPGIKASPGVYSLCLHVEKGEYAIKFHGDGSYECDKKLVRGWVR